MATSSSNHPITSKAITYKGPGGYDVISVVERTVRAPEANEVRIEVKAAAVNPTDVLLRKAGIENTTSLVIPGMDAAGTIDAVGPGVERLRKGQQVIAVVMPRRRDGGAQAQHIVVPAASVVPVPDGVSLAQASTLPMNGLTALRALELAELAKGQTLAVSGGAGLLAHYTIAMAKRQGHRVIADAKREEADLVRSYGADVVIERGPDFSRTIRREVPNGVDALLDTAVLGEKAFGAIRDGGIYLGVRGGGNKGVERGIAFKSVLVFEVLDRTDWLEQLRDLVATGKIKLRVAGEFKSDHLADAQSALEAGGLRGRPVIVF